MSNFTTPRQSALTALIAWAPRNLRSDDELGVLDFAGNAVWEHVPTSVGQPLGPAKGTLNPNGTQLEPLLEAVSELPVSPCDTDVVLLSDAQVSDLPSSATSGRTLLLAHRVHEIALLVPGTQIVVDPNWADTFPEADPVRFDGNNGEQTGLALARVIAAFAGQQLVRR